MATTDAKAGFRLPWSSDRSSTDEMDSEQLATADAAVKAGRRLTPTVQDAEGPTSGRAQDRHRAKPRDFQGLCKRLMGLEPTTFCMAISCSSPDTRCLSGFAIWWMPSDCIRLPGFGQ